MTNNIFGYNQTGGNKQRNTHNNIKTNIINNNSEFYNKNLPQKDKIQRLLEDIAWLKQENEEEYQELINIKEAKAKQLGYKEDIIQELDNIDRIALNKEREQELKKEIYELWKKKSLEDQELKKETYQLWKTKSEQEAQNKRLQYELWKEKGDKDIQSKKEQYELWATKAQKDAQAKNEQYQQWTKKAQQDLQDKKSILELWRKKSQEEAAEKRALAEMYQTMREPTKQEKAIRSIRIAEAINKGTIGADLLRGITKKGKAIYADKNLHRKEIILTETNKLIKQGVEPNTAISLATQKFINLEKESPELQIGGYTYEQIYDSTKRNAGLIDGKQVKARKIGITKDKEGKIHINIQKTTKTGNQRLKIRMLQPRAIDLFNKYTEQYIRAGLTPKEASLIAQAKVNTELRKEEEERSKLISQGKWITNPKIRKGIKHSLNKGFGGKFRGKNFNQGIGII